MKIASSFLELMQLLMVSMIFSSKGVCVAGHSYWVIRVACACACGAKLLRVSFGSVARLHCCPRPCFRSIGASPGRSSMHCGLARLSKGLLCFGELQLVIKGASGAVGLPNLLAWVSGLFK